MIRATLAIALIGSGLGLLGWAIGALERWLVTLPVIVVELASGFWLCLLWQTANK